MMMNKNWSKYLTLILLCISIFGYCVSGSQCSCPRHLKVLSDSTISAIESVQFGPLEEEDKMMDYVDIVKNGTCAYRWVPHFYSNHIVTPLNFHKMVRISPCFEDNDMIDIFVSMTSCCQNKALKIGNRLRIDLSASNRLNIYFDLDKTHKFALVVKTSFSDRSTPICHSSTNRKNFTILNNIFQLSVVNSPDSIFVAGWQYIQNENCFVNLFGSDITTIDRNEITRMFHKNECFRNVSIYVAPLYDSQDKISCGEPLPYLFQFAARDSLRRNNVTLTNTKVHDGNMIVTCSIVENTESPESQNPRECEDQQVKGYQERVEDVKNCTCLKEPYVFSQGVNGIRVSGILKSGNSTLIIANPRDYTKMNLPAVESETIDLQDMVGFLAPMDTFQILVYAPQCDCINRFVVLAEGIVFDPTQSNELYIDWSHEPALNSHWVAPSVTLVESHRSLDDAPGINTHCDSLSRFATYGDYSLVRTTSFMQGYYPDKWANAFQFYHIKSGCHYNYRPAPLVFATGYWVFKLYASSLRGALDKVGCNAMNEDEFFVVPVRLNDDNTVAQCYKPFPFKYPFSSSTQNWNLHFSIHTDVRLYEYDESKLQLLCHSDYDNDRDTMYDPPGAFDACSNMDDLCSKCVEGYHFNQIHRCVPNLKFASQYQSVKLQFEGPFREYESWEMRFDVFRVTANGLEPVSGGTKVFDQFEFRKNSFLLVDLEIGEYEVSYGPGYGEPFSDSFKALLPPTSIVPPETFRFTTNCAPQHAQVKVDSISVVVEFPEFFPDNYIVYSVTDMSTFEVNYALMDHTDIKLTKAQAASYKISRLTPGTTYKLSYFGTDNKGELRGRPCDGEITFKTTCNCGSVPGDDSPIIDQATVVSQSYGFVTFLFRDNSRCDTGYSFERQDVYADGSFSDGNVFTPVYINFQNKECQTIFNPGKVAADDLSVSELTVGKTYRYSIRGVASGYVGSPAYALHQIRWESSISGMVGLSGRANNIAVADVKISWSLKDLQHNVIRKGSTMSDARGKFYIQFNEQVKFSNFEAYPVEFKFEKTSLMADGTMLNHEFLCDHDSKNCTVTGTTVYLKHLDFDQELRVTDDSVVPINGKTFIANTRENPSKDNCPKENVTMCLVDKFVGADDNRIVCIETGGDGSFSLPAPIGANISVQATYQNHTFEFIPTDARYKDASTGFVVEAGIAYTGFNFQDTTTATLAVTIAGGLCDIYLGEASLQFAVDGCEWGGISVKQNKLVKEYSLPAQNTRVIVNEITDRRDIEFNFQTIDLGATLTNTDKKSDFEMRFQYDGKPIINVDFQNNMNAGCSTDKNQLVVLQASTPMFAVIYMVRDLGQGKLCDNVDPSNKIRIDNGLGLLPDSPSDKEYRDELAKTHPKEIMDLFEVCTSGCARSMTRDLDPLTQKYTASRVALLLIPGRPSLIAPYRKYFTVTPMENNAKQYVAEVVVVGHYKISDKYSVGLPTHEPLLIIRDPPGGGSSSFYQNVRSTIRVDNKRFEVYGGSDWGNDLKVGLKMEETVCAGAFLMLCTDVFKLKDSANLEWGETNFGTTILNHKAHTAEFTTTWSYTTSTDQFMIGEQSDVFVVPNLNIHYAETAIIEWNVSECKASRRDDYTFYLKNPDNTPALGFVTGYEIENVEIPELTKLYNDTEKKLKNNCDNEDEDECNMLREKLATIKDGIEGWRNALQLNKELKAKAVGEAIRPDEWFTKIIKPQFQEAEIETNDIKFNSGMASSELLSKAVLRKRYENANLKTTNLATLNSIKFSGGGSSYTYQLNQNQMQSITAMIGGADSNFEGSTKQGFVNKFEAYIVHLHAEDNFERMFKDSESASHTIEDTKKTDASVGFTLSDPNIGDVFNVRVYIDPRFGTFVFHTLNGRSSCPREPGTDPRIEPRMEVLASPPETVLPDRPMVFQLRITNTGDYPGSFVLNYENLNAVYGGLTFYRILPLQYDRIEPGESVYTTFSINRGPVEYEYPPLKLKLQCACETGQDLKLLGIGGVSESVVTLYNKISNAGEQKLVYAQECPKVYLAGDIQKTQTFQVTRTLHSNDILPVVIRNPHGSTRKLSDAVKLDSTRLKNVQLQYRRVLSPEWNVGQRRADGKVVAIDFSEAGLEDEYGFISVDWAVDTLGSGDYEFRVISLCREIESAPMIFNFFATETITGSIDRGAPRIFGAPTPFEKLEVDSDIQVEFDERLDCSEPFSFSVNLKFNNEEKAFGNKDLLVVCEERLIAIMFDSSQYDISAFVGKHINMNILNVSDIHGNAMQGVISYEAEIIPVSLERRRLLEKQASDSELLEHANEILSTTQHSNANNVAASEELRSQLLHHLAWKTSIVTGLAFSAIGLGVVAVLWIALACCRKGNSEYSDMIPEGEKDNSLYNPPNVNIFQTRFDRAGSDGPALFRVRPERGESDSSAGVRRRSRTSTLSSS